MSNRIEFISSFHQLLEPNIRILLWCQCDIWRKVLATLTYECLWRIFSLRAWISEFFHVTCFIALYVCSSLLRHLNYSALMKAGFSNFLMWKLNLIVFYATNRTFSYFHFSAFYWSFAMVIWVTNMLKVYVYLCSHCNCCYGCGNSEKQWTGFRKE